MFSILAIGTLLSTALLGVQAQYNAHVGPLTPLSSKTHICNVMNYGAKADNATDIGPAITSAYTSCIKTNPGSTLLIPAGTYALKSSVTMKGSSKWAFQLDGLIIASHAGTIGGNMIVFQNQDDLEVFSSNGQGAINGQGYVWRIIDGTAGSKPRIMRFITCTNFSVHNLLLVDAPQFHLVVDNGQNVEVANITIRGPSIGGSDGIDISGNNYYVHDCDVSNRDECVSVKSPSTNGSIKRMRCNNSGGMSIGSLKAGAVVENIVFDTIDNFASTEGLMIKTYPSPAGTAAGYVRNILATNFRNWNSTYTAYITQYWQNTGSDPDGAGVQISNVTFSNWSGSNVNGYQRGYIVVVGSKYAVPYDINFVNFDMYSTTLHGKIGELNRCSDVYGKGGCVATASGTAHPSGFTSTQTLQAAPTGWVAPARPSWAVDPYPVYAPIPVYSPVPKYPFDFGSTKGVAAIVALAQPTTSSVGPVSVNATVVAPTTSSTSSAVATAAETSTGKAKCLRK